MRPQLCIWIYLKGESKMTLRRVILEMGAGNDLHGGDYTKAAKRAVQDALHHSSLTMIRTLGVERDDVQVEAIRIRLVGVQPAV